MLRTFFNRILVQQIIRRPSSDPGLDDPGTALATLAPDTEKELNVAVSFGDAGSGDGGATRGKNPTPELFTGESVIFS